MTTQLRMFINHVAVLSIFVSVALAQYNNPNLDQFNYRGTEYSVNNDYGPVDWDRIRCADVDTCLGWPDNWDVGVGWSLTKNFCQWCPADDDAACGKHHQSPIALDRNVAVVGSPNENDCIDVHRMHYLDSTCDFDILQAANAFVIARHALRVLQPIEPLGHDTYRLGCKNASGRRWGRIDFSRGFSQWWLLSHADFHVPSEHTQDGVRYDGEIHLYHFYSVSAAVAGIHNEMASVTAFLKVYDDAEDYPILNRIICQWRAVEEATREECGLPSVQDEYPGCSNRRRLSRHNTTSSSSETGNRRNLRQTEETPPSRTIPLTAHDIIMNNHMQSDNTAYVPKRIILEPEDMEPVTEVDWEAFIAEQYAKDGQNQGERHLLDYNNVEWFNYFPMTAVRTEYYFRYSGAQTVPPCYGKWYPGNDRHQTNHWRVMKDPIRVTQRQIDEMHRLLRMRIAPKSDPLRACQTDTAAKPNPNNPDQISVARPLQSTRSTHYETFCECRDWDSMWREDQNWCQLDKMERLFNQPYNFKSNGF